MEYHHLQVGLQLGGCPSQVLPRLLYRVLGRGRAGAGGREEGIEGEVSLRAYVCVRLLGLVEGRREGGRRGEKEEEGKKRCGDVKREVLYARV